MSFPQNKIIAKENQWQKDSLKIDQLLLKDSKDQKSNSILDIVFVRRIYLETVGRIPKAKEIKIFLQDQNKNKRSDLINQLMNSNEHPKYFYHFWADMLRLQTKIKGVYNNQYAKWVKKSIAENKPYNQIVYELISASGYISQNGAVGYYLRDEGKILEIASTTAQLFLGTQIGCAQCHDHAFEDWTQKQFYEFASYMGKVKLKMANAKPYRKLVKKENLSQKEIQTLRRLIQTATTKITDIQSKKLRLPKDYKYNNAKPNQIIHPKVFLKDQPLANENSRIALAKWLTSPKNPLFTKITVNRLWKKVMGKGLFEPVDDYNQNTKVNHPEVLAYLEKKMIEYDYNTNDFLKLLLNTKHYQLPTSSENLSRSKYYTDVRQLQRMKAEQVWNSLLTIIKENINQEVDYHDKNISRPLIAIADKIQKEGLKIEQLPQILEIVKSTANRKNKMNKSKSKRFKKRNKRGGSKRFGRASEQSSPPREQHILNYFGQSDRLMIGTGNQDPNLPQVLTLLNSPEINKAISKSPFIKREIKKLKNSNEIMDFIYLTIISRLPTPEEKETIIKYIKTHKKTAYQDLAWALINTREFLFIQ